MKTTMYCKRILAVALALLMVATTAILTVPQAEAAKIPESGNNCNIKAYTLQTSGNVRVYTNAICTTGGNEYISAASDECYIQKINPNCNSLYVSYPTRSGRKSRWVPASVFTGDSGALTGTPIVMTAPAKITTYKRNSTGASYGSISKGDRVYVLETSGSMTRVVYPISGGWYKMAWALNTQLFPFSNGNYKIRTLLNTNYCIDVCGASQESGANVQVYHHNTESNAQNFTITHVKDGWYKIQNMGSGKVLDVANGSTASGTNVWQCNWNGSDAQLWQIINTGNGYYLRNKLGCFLDVVNGTATDSNNVWAYAFNGSNAQKFTFTGALSVTPSPTPAPTPSTTTGYVKTSNQNNRLNVRSSPNTSSRIAARLAYGTKVTIVGETGSWYQISSPANGYVSKAYIVLDDPNSNPNPTPTSNSMTNALYKINSSSSHITCGFNGYTSTPGYHEGIDFKNYLNAPVYSLTDGVITRVSNGYVGRNGLSTIAVYNSAKNVTIVYLHTKPLSGLYVGQQISTGQQIATESWRGVSSQSGAHTHVELRLGRCTSAAYSVNNYVLENPNPTSYWNAFGYTVF